jgi:two-component system NtrC family sensor kinase
MEKIQEYLKFSFATKVLVPVITCMIVLVGVTTWTVSRLMTRAFEHEATQRLANAHNVLQDSQKIFTKKLLLRFTKLQNEPQYRAALQSRHLPTIQDQVNNLPGDQDVDVVLFTSPEGKRLSAKRNSWISIPDFEAASSNAVSSALEGTESADTIRVGDRLLDVVSIPIFVSGENVGVLTFGAEIGEAAAREFKLITQSEIVLLANGHVTARTLLQPEMSHQFSEMFSGIASNAESSAVPQKVQYGGEHFFYSAGTFPSMSGDKKLGYLILFSYEKGLQALATTQQTLLLISTVGILAGTLIVFLLLQKVTEPLRELRDSAEAVGKGDFTRRVTVKSGDECGELAFVFNQMTENLQRSREQLVSTVETLKSTQAQLIQSEKLSGIGEFVAGVAHELNNPLTSVMGFSELLSRAEVNPQHKRHLEMIHKSALRCQKIVQSLLSFARRRQPERKLSNLNELVQNAVEFLSYQLRTSNIQVITELDPALPGVMVDPHQLQQVFLNLINNARQAMEAHQPKGTIRITSDICGQIARIIFQDDGPGISENNLSKIFDPFFTTKEVGQGTGLGLSLCYGIVKDHGGSIQVRSRAGEGAAFIIDIPIALEATPGSGGDAAAPAPTTAPARNAAANGKRVLIIDDEEGILEILRETLTEDGYDVDVASDGQTALARASKTAYDLALCDWKMPGLNGEQVYKRLGATNPRLSERMIFMTGDVINARTQQFLKDHQKVCLSKPFSLVEFRAAVEKALAN